MVLVVKNLPAEAGDLRDMSLIPGSGRFPWRRKWQLTPVLLPGEFHGQRSLAGYSPWGHRVGHDCVTNFCFHPNTKGKMFTFLFSLLFFTICLL